MAEHRIVIVMLRQPRLEDPSEMRTDPLWEFGSFGCTGCHRKNLMNPEEADRAQRGTVRFCPKWPAGDQACPCHTTSQNAAPRHVRRGHLGAIGHAAAL